MPERAARCAKRAREGRNGIGKHFRTHQHAGGWPLAAVAIAAVVVAAVVANSPAAVSCDKVAAPSGSDSAAGTAASPYRTAQKLADSLRAGTDRLPAGRPLRAGRDDRRRGGSAGSPVTLTSYPGERATRARAASGCTDSANFVTVESLDLDGRDAANLPSPSVYGDDVVFRDNDVTDYHTGICFLLGSNALRAGEAGDDRAQPHPRLRGAAGAEPPSRDLHRGTRTTRRI